MNSFGFLLKNSFRHAMQAARSYYAVFLGLAILVFFLLLQFDIVFSWVKMNQWVARVIIASVSFFYIFRSYPPVLVNPAIPFLLRTSRELKKIIYLKIIMTICTYCIFALLLVLVQGEFNLIQFLSFFIGLLAAACIGWSRYNHQYSFVLYISIALLFCITIFTSQELLIVFSSLVILLVFKRQPQFDANAYIELMQQIYRMYAAAARMDMAVLQHEAQKNVVEKRYSLKLEGAMLSYPLLGKSLVVDTIRLARPIWMMVCALFGIIIVAVFLLPDYSLYKPIIVCVFGSAVAAVGNEYCGYMREVVLKIKIGFPIRVKNLSLVFSNMLLPLVASILILVFHAFIIGLSYIGVLVAVVVVSIGLFICGHVTVAAPEKKRATDYLYLFFSIVASGVLFYL